MLNRGGPKIEPCGTPNFTASHSLYELLTLVLCFLCDRWSWINLKAGRLNPLAFNFAIRSAWLRQSKALNKSLCRETKALPLSTDLFHFSGIAKKHCCVLWPFLSPHGFLRKYFQKSLIFAWSCFLRITLTKPVRYLQVYSYLSSLFSLSYK